MSRLQRFRAYMSGMNPVEDPNHAIDRGMYVARPGMEVATQITRRLELEPSSAHLVVGGIGSGKTSELRVTEQRLKAALHEAGDHVQYIDVGRSHDLGAESLTGVLVALAGEALATTAVARPGMEWAVDAARDAIKRHARGYTRWEFPAGDEDYEPDDDPRDAIHVPGALVPPERPVAEALTALVPHLQTLLAAQIGDEAHAIFLFDSLDRLPVPSRFRDVVQDDLRVLKAAGIGVVAVGPVRFMVNGDRTVTDLFDNTHFLPPVDPEQPNGLRFLTEVLRRRVDSAMLPDACLDPLARASGGILRDLIALAKGAGDEAYAAGHDSIDRSDVDRAADALGRNLAVGLHTRDIETLRFLHASRVWWERDEDLTLIDTRRVLAYENQQWRVHPALVPYVVKVAASA